MAERADGERWRPRPVAAWAIRALVVLVPAALSVLFSLWLSRALPPPDGVVEVVLWWTMLALASLAVMLLALRVCRRALPLAALLDLSLIFPDAAPSRFRLARRTLTNLQVHEVVEDIQEELARDLRGPEAARRSEDILALVAALSVHDRRTRGHSERVRVYADMIAAEMGLSRWDRDRLHWSALLHDIGKLEVDAGVLNNPEQPAAEDWEKLRRHPEAGARLLEPLNEWMGPWVLAAAHHHERWDGKGYPFGLSGQQISMAGRIVAVADCYETMVAGRPYKRPLSPVAAREELVTCAGSQFDPAVVRAFLNVSAGRLWRAAGVGAVLAQVPVLGVPLGALSRGGNSGPSVALTAGAMAALVAAGSISPAVLIAGAVLGVSATPARHTGGADPAPATVPTGGAALAQPPGTPVLVSPPVTQAGFATVSLPTTGARPGVSARPPTAAAPPPAAGHGASPHAPGRSANQPPGHGGTPPGHSR